MYRDKIDLLLVCSNIIKNNFKRRLHFIEIAIEINLTIPYCEIKVFMNLGSYNVMKGEYVMCLNLVAFFKVLKTSYSHLSISGS